MRRSPLLDHHGHRSARLPSDQDDCTSAPPCARRLGAGPLISALLLAFGLHGCAVVTVAGAAVSVAATAVSVTASAVETTVDIAVAGVDAVVGDDDDQGDTRQED